jgi:transcription termination/antitermination protein NusG
MGNREGRETVHWYAVHVKSRHEFTVSERLMQAGIEVFLPSIERLHKWKDRNKLVRYPLFPSYLFVHTSRSHHDRLAILRTQGVVNILGVIPGEPDPIPDEQILSLKKVIESKTYLDPYPYLTKGQKIRIIKGPLAGIEGIFIDKAGQHKLILSVDLLSQSAAVTIQASEVEKI